MPTFGSDFTKTPILRALRPARRSLKTRDVKVATALLKHTSKHMAARLPSSPSLSSLPTRSRMHVFDATHKPWLVQTFEVLLTLSMAWLVLSATRSISQPLPGYSSPRVNRISVMAATSISVRNFPCLSNIRLTRVRWPARIATIRMARFCQRGASLRARRWCVKRWGMKRLV